MFKKTYSYEFEEDDCTVEKEITVEEANIREAIELILEEKKEEEIIKIADEMFDKEEIEGLNLEEKKAKIAKDGELDLLTDWFWDELNDFFREIARDEGKVVSTDSYADYINDYNAGMAYYRANC